MIQTQQIVFKNLIKLPNILWGKSPVDIQKIFRQPSAGQILHGQFSLAYEDDAAVFLIRDRLGLNKLFYHIDEDKKIVTAGNYLVDLIEKHCPHEKIFSVPAGHYVRIDKAGFKKQVHCYYDISSIAAGGPFDMVDFQKKVKEALTGGFEFLKENFKECEYFVCLSGGLDSAVIANFAKRYLNGRVKAVTFTYALRETIQKYGTVIADPEAEVLSDSLLSDDFHRAYRIAKILGLPFVAVLVEKKIDPADLRQVLTLGQDWRDFNVHCAWVNYHIALNIKKYFSKTSIVFLTGDLMNEFMADYTAVDYKGETYYFQPRIKKDRLRKFYVYGLDAGDREIGVFYSQNTRVIQPYSLVAELYLTVPGNFLEDPQAKQKLNADLLLDQAVLKKVSQKKLRSQVGGEDRGTLGLFHDAGITENVLKEQWISLLAKPTDTQIQKASLLKFIYAGRYRH